MSGRHIRGPLCYDTVVTVLTGNYTVVNESMVVVNKTSGAPTTITLPPSQGASASSVREVIVLDGKGDAATNNITVTPAGTDNINGANSSVVIAANSARVVFTDEGASGWVYSSVAGGGAGSFTTVATSGLATLNSAVVTNNLTAGSLTTTGPVTEGALAGAAGSNVTITKNLSGMADATDAALFTITVPNVLAGATVAVTLHGTLGDGDSTDSAFYTVGVSRIAGANAKAVAATKGNIGATAGATANAVVIITVPAVTGAVGATNTFAVTARVTRSAGAATNHFVTAEVTLLNGKAGGVTIS